MYHIALIGAGLLSFRRMAAEHAERVELEQELRVSMTRLQQLCGSGEAFTRYRKTLSERSYGGRGSFGSSGEEILGQDEQAGDSRPSLPVGPDAGLTAAQRSRHGYSL